MQNHCGVSCKVLIRNFNKTIQLKQYFFYRIFIYPYSEMTNKIHMTMTNENTYLFEFSYAYSAKCLF